MKDQEFKQKLSEVAEWRIPKTLTGTVSGDAKKPRKAGRPSNEELYQEQQEKEFLAEFDGINPTFPPQLTKVKSQHTVCDDCGLDCPQGRRTEAKLHTKGSKRVWRQKCLTCNKFQNPFNGCFELVGAAASIKFNDFMRETKGIYKTKGNQNRNKTVIKAEPVATVLIENDQEKITFYSDSNAEK